MPIKRLSGESLMKWYEKIISNFSKNYYNRKSAKELGWKPDWFGEPTYSKKLSQKISKFQKCYGLRVTGVVDEQTWYKFQKFAKAINRIRYQTGIKNDTVLETIYEKRGL